MKKILLIILILTIWSCSENKIDKKGFQVREIIKDEDGEKKVGLPIANLKIESKPRNILLTQDANHRLTPIYKVNYHKKTHNPFTGSTRTHTNYSSYGTNEENNWNNNFMPGFAAVYGYNLVNVSHYNNVTKEENTFFDTPVLIKTLYYPAFSKDTLNTVAIQRNFYMVSAYDTDTNGDGYINTKDLRRLYHFDIDAKTKNLLIPQNYSVINSEYDPANDLMYVFARIDKNENGQMEYEEPTHVFWVDLKNPQNNGLQYQGE